LGIRRKRTITEGITKKQNMKYYDKLEILSHGGISVKGEIILYKNTSWFLMYEDLDSKFIVKRTVSIDEVDSYKKSEAMGEIIIDIKREEKLNDPSHKEFKAYAKDHLFPKPINIENRFKRLFYKALQCLGIIDFQ